MTDIVLNKENIKKYLLISEPYLFVDEVKIFDKKKATGIRFFPKDEWFFKCHFLTDPVVPGVFQLEHIMQTGALAVLAQEIPDTNIIYGKNFKDLNLISFVRPGETLHCETEVLSFRRGLGLAKGTAWVERNNEKVITSTATFQMVSPTLLNKFIPGANKC